MKVNLVCSNKSEKILTEILRHRKIDLDHSAVIHFVEQGISAPESGVSAIFDDHNLNELIDFLDCFQSTALKNQSPDILTDKKDDSFEVLQPDLFVSTNLMWLIFLK